MHYQVALTLKSRNTKTGPIPVSTTTAKTCPAACPLAGKNGGCYANYGQGPLGLYWQKVTMGEFGMTWSAFTALIASMPEGSIWRHNQAGDLPGSNNRIDAAALDELVTANAGKRGFTYTHYPVEQDNASNRKAIKAANDGGFTINLSANSALEIDAMAELDIAPVVTVLPIEYGRKAQGDEWTETLDEYRARTAGLPRRTKGGRAIAVCPATYLDTNCKDCGLCQRRDRKCAVGFPAHGMAKKAAAKLAA